MSLLRQDAFDKVGRVAVWFGFFTDELDLDAYLSDDFDHDFGFRHTGRETMGSEYAVTAQFVPMRELVAEFSGSRSYTEAVVAAAAAARAASASTMLVIFNVEFDPERVAINPLAPLTFLGNFDFEGYS